MPYKTRERKGRWSPTVSLAVGLGIARFVWGTEPPDVTFPGTRQSPSRTSTHSARPVPSRPGSSIRQVSGTESPEALANDDETLDDRGTSIDLVTALRLAGVENLELVIARQRVEEAVAIQQLAAAQMLPTINIGTNYDAHTGNVQQSSGRILNLQRSALYVGAGANAVAAGTVSIPGVQWNLNVSESIYNFFSARQPSEQARFANQTGATEVPPPVPRRDD